LACLQAALVRLNLDAVHACRDRLHRRAVRGQDETTAEVFPWRTSPLLLVG
jgi:hypothetical protein